MFRSALVAVDGAQHDQDAALLARQLCDSDAALTLADVHCGARSVAASESSSGQDTEARVSELDLQRASQMTGVTRTASIAAANVGEGLSQLAKRGHADLLVLGSHGAPEGTVACADWLGRSLTHVPCPVAIAPEGYQHRSSRTIQTVGVAYDDSDQSRRAVLLARHIARESKLKLLGFRTSTSINTESSKIAAEITQDLRDFAGSLDLLVISPRAEGRFARLGHPRATLALLHGIPAALLLVPEHARLPVAEREPVPDRRLALDTHSRE